jgi:hypothetical protein
MKNMILLFSHKLSETQIKQAREIHNVENFISLPQELQTSWSNISPDLESIIPTIEPIKEFLGSVAKQGDFVLIQGDFGAVYTLVQFCKENNLTPLYATTKRRINESINQKGEEVKTSIFEHVRFREYE